MTLDEIRALDPRYADVPARELLEALHQQMYSSIPFEDFVSRIDGAQEALLGFPTPQGGVSVNQPEFEALRDDIRSISPEDIGTAVNQGIEGLTFGLIGDEFNAAFDSLHPNITYDERLQWYRENEDQLRADHPGLATGSELAGAAVGAFVPGLNVARNAGLGTRAGATAMGGGLMAGTHNFMEGEGGLEGRVEGTPEAALLGAGAGVGAHAAGGALQRIMDGVLRRRATRAASADAPTTQELRAEAGRLYGAVDDAGIQIRPESVAQTSDYLTDYLRGEGAGLPMADVAVPQSRGALAALDQLGEGSDAVPWQELDMFRRGLQNGTAAAARDAGNDGRIMSGVLQRFDDRVASMGPDDVVAGSVDALELLPAARDMWAQQARTGLLDDAMENAQSYVSGEASGIRNQFGSLLRNPANRGRFSDAEQALIRRAAQGTIPQQILYGLQGGIGNLATMGTGFAAGGVPGMAVGGLASMGLRGLSNRMARNTAQRARDIVANGGIEEMPTANPEIAQMIRHALTNGGAVAVP